MRLYLLLSLTLVISSPSFAQDFKAKVHEYFSAQKAVEHNASTEKDVDALLSLLSDTATFEHPSYNAVQNKTQYQKGLLFYLGQYGQCDIIIGNMIVGLNAVVVEYKHPCIDKNGQTNKQENNAKLVTLFEFKDEKINLIRHYF